MKLRKFLKPGILVVLVMFIATMLTACGNSPKSVVNDYMKANIKGNAKKLVSLTYKEQMDDMLEAMEMTKKEYIEELEERWDDMDKDDKKDLKKTKWKIVDVDDVKEKELEAMQDAWEYDKELKDAKKVKVEITNADGDEMEQTYTVIKVGSKWYMR